MNEIITIASTLTKKTTSSYLLAGYSALQDLKHLSLSLSVEGMWLSPSLLSATASMTVATIVPAMVVVIAPIAVIAVASISTVMTILQ